MYTICETFVGAGGSHLGFKENGFVSKYVNDFSKDALKTLTVNNPKIKKTAWIDATDIMTIDSEEILERTAMQRGELDVLFGGIVCKGFSLAGERSPNDQRNYFYRKQLELVRALSPKISIIENVPGLRTAKVVSETAPKEMLKRVDEIWKQLENYKGEKAKERKRGGISKELEEKGQLIRKKKKHLMLELEKKGYLISVMEEILDTYKKIGYKVFVSVLNAACYGAATKRERIIIVAVRKNLKTEFDFPAATHGDVDLAKKYPHLYRENKKVKPVLTVNDVLKLIDYTEEGDSDNIPMKHNEKTIRRFKYIPEGDNISKHIERLPKELVVSKFYSRGSTMRLCGDKASPTLVPGHSNFPIHPKEHRSITVREAAMITGFPPKYKFFGNHSKRCEAVGNAVPPPLARAIAKEVKKTLDDFYNGKAGR